MAWSLFHLSLAYSRLHGVHLVADLKCDLWSELFLSVFFMLFHFTAVLYTKEAFLFDVDLHCLVSLA